MTYSPHAWSYKTPVYASWLNEMDAQIVTNEEATPAVQAAVAELEESVTDLIEDTSITGAPNYLKMDVGNMTMTITYIPTTDTWLPPTAITGPSEMDLIVGTKTQLPHTVSPENTSMITRYYSSDRTIVQVNRFGVVTPVKVGKTTIQILCGDLSKTVAVNVSAIERPTFLDEGPSMGIKWHVGNENITFDTLPASQSKVVQIMYRGVLNSYFAWPKDIENYPFTIPPHCTATFHLDNRGYEMANGSVENMFKFWYYFVVRERDSNGIMLHYDNITGDWFIYNCELVSEQVIEENDRVHDLVFNNTSNVNWYPCLALVVTYQPVPHERWIEAMRRLTCTIVPNQS